MAQKGLNGWTRCILKMTFASFCLCNIIKQYMTGTCIWGKTYDANLLEWKTLGWNLRYFGQTKEKNNAAIGMAWHLGVLDSIICNRKRLSTLLHHSTFKIMT